MLRRACYTSLAVRCHPGCRCNYRHSLPAIVWPAGAGQSAAERFYKDLKEVIEEFTFLSQCRV